ncbi:MAG: L-lactate dehydrogenase [Anaerolineae bacterium]|jgi:L-lactate dehydrogenase|nr:L-lactate dehydrogenase [Anaerolineae bacterium]PKO02077.1 MAG: L-lactate dehydrogenase [Chloroflexi bacterium HGW-Chloroflexi-5]
MNKDTYQPTRIAIVGTGNVGATFAYALLQSGLAAEIVLIDRNHTRAEGEAMDLNHAVPLAHATRIWAGTYEDTAGAAVTVITAGSGQKEGETRLDLVSRNYEILKGIIPEIVKNNPTGIILIATNPVDILSYAAWKISGLPSERVIGSGTILDTARFRYLLSEHAGVDAKSVHAYIIGEHGDSEVPVWSSANIGGMDLKDYCPGNCEGYCEECCKDFDSEVYEKIFRETRDAAYEIIKRKGATYYAIGNGLLRIVEAILRGQDSVLSVSTLITGYYGINDVYLSLPSVIGHNGVKRTMFLKLNEKEKLGIQNSANVLHDTLDKIGVR